MPQIVKKHPNQRMNGMSTMTPDSNTVVWRKCSPFCDKAIECPEHHDLLQGIVNCTDQLGHLSNLDTLRGYIDKYQVIISNT